MQEATTRVLMAMVTVAAAGCSSMPEPRMLVPTGKISPQQVASLGRASGTVVDVLTVGGEETYLLLDSVSDSGLSGQLVYPQSAQPVTEQSLRIPFNETALAYYVEPAGKSKAGPAPGRGLPFKYSYPEIPAAGAAEKRSSCAELDLELSRAEALRWFARDEGLMGYTPGQELAHHATTTAIVAGVTLLVLAGGGNGLPIPAGPRPYEDPTLSLRDQVGFDTLRWGISAADVRVAGLLRIKRDNGCPERSTLIDGESDVQILQQFDALHERTAAQKLSGVALLHEQTRLLDMLGPRPLPEGSLADCGTFQCDNRRDPRKIAEALENLGRLIPGLADERMVRVFDNAVWFGETPTVWARAKMQVRHENSLGSLFIFNKSLVFASGSIGEPGTQPDGPPPIRLSYAGIASVELGQFGLNRWVAIHCRDDHAYFFSMAEHGGGGTIERAQTQAAAQLLQSMLQPLGQRNDAGLVAIPTT